MPIQMTVLQGERIILAVLTGEVTGPELAAWRLGLAGTLDASTYHIVYDILGHTGSVHDDDLMALARQMNDPPSDRQTIVVSLDPMMRLWNESVGLRAGAAVPGRRFSVARSRAEALARLRIPGG